MSVWRYEFDPYGGYDCMSSAYEVYENDRLCFSIECQYGDQVARGGVESDAWDVQHGTSAKTEALAARIVRLLNSEEVEMHGGQT